jgi:hypothetical protein
MNNYVKTIVCAAVCIVSICGIGCAVDHKKCQYYGYSMTCTRSGCKGKDKALVICTPCKAVGDKQCKAYCENCESGDYITIKKQD